MLYFLKDTYLEFVRGKPPGEIKEMHRQQAEKHTLPSAKTIVLVFGILYLIVAAGGIVLSLRAGATLNVVKYIVLLILDIAGVILLFTDRKKYAWLCIGAFLVLNCLTTFLG